MDLLLLAKLKYPRHCTEKMTKFETMMIALLCIATL